MQQAQWQNGYPNPETVNSDIEKQIVYVLVENDRVIAYYAVILNDEPAYENIEGNGLRTGISMWYTD